MLNKKGAMFGLDARIALAIFGALSVISGAALYSAVQEAKTIHRVASVSEAIKAFEAYYLDTGEIIKEGKKGSGFLNIISLIEDSGVAGWKGPYLPFEVLLPDDGVTYPSLNFPFGSNCSASGTGNMLRFIGKTNTNGLGTDYILELKCINKPTAEGITKKLSNKDLSDVLITGNYYSPYDSDKKIAFFDRSGDYILYYVVMTLK